jgi:type IV pilus assembly protein PilP
MPALLRSGAADMIGMPAEVVMRRLIRVVPLSIIVLVACSTDRAAPPQPAPIAVAAVETVGVPLVPAPLVANEGAMPAPLDLGRDPFEASAATKPSAPAVARDDRPRKSKRFTLDELKLVGIVSNADTPRAMLVDPRGKGWVVTRGELVGRAETIRDGEGDHAVSWRVDRIRQSDVVLVREDAAHSAVPSSTRVLALRHDPVISDDAELDD